MNFKSIILLVVILSSGLVLSCVDEAPPTTPEIISQKSIGEQACGVCALLNALKFGGEAERTAAAKIKGSNDEDRVQTIIEVYGHVPSDAYPERSRYREDEGMCDREMLGMVQDFLTQNGLGRIEGGYLDRAKEEPVGTHLRKVHAKLRRSLDLGFPPIVLIRSFAAEPDSKFEAGYSWGGLCGHWVSIVSLPEKLEPDAISFVMQVADSASGRLQECFVHEEQFRNFTAAKGDTRTYTWPTVPRPFLVVTTPGIGLYTAKVPWFLRSNVVLSYGIYRIPPASASTSK